MNISIPDPLRDWVQSRVDSGAYAGVSDYVRDLIRRDQAAVQDKDRLLKDLRSSLSLSIAQADAGDVVDAEDVFARLEAKYRAMAESRSRR